MALHAGGSEGHTCEARKGLLRVAAVGMRSVAPLDRMTVISRRAGRMVYPKARGGAGTILRTGAGSRYGPGATVGRRFSGHFEFKAISPEIR